MSFISWTVETVRQEAIDSGIIATISLEATRIVLKTVSYHPSVVVFENKVKILITSLRKRYVEFYMNSPKDAIAIYIAKDGSLSIMLYSGSIWAKSVYIKG